MRLATWNVNSLKARMPLLVRWLTEVHPDVACLQETKSTDSAFPFAAFGDLGYEAAHHGDGRWNGVAILSRVGLEDVRRGFSNEGPGTESECRFISAVCGGTYVGSVYVPNGRIVGSEHYDTKIAFLEALGEETARRTTVHDEMVLAGDFNVAPTDLDVFDPAYFEGSTHVTPLERSLVGALTQHGLVDVFRQAYPAVGGLFSWWDYRAGDFHKGRGMRIDLVLATQNLIPLLSFALIDRNARKGQGSKTQPQPSDHAPVVIELAASR